MATEVKCPNCEGTAFRPSRYVDGLTECCRCGRDFTRAQLQGPEIHIVDDSGRIRPGPDALEAAHERIRLAQEALVRTGYFKPNEVSDDIAPRIGEYATALTTEIERLKEEIRDLRKRIAELAYAQMDNV